MPMPEPPSNLVPESVLVSTESGEKISFWKESGGGPDAFVAALMALSDITAGRYSIKVESWVEPDA